MFDALEILSFPFWPMNWCWWWFLGIVWMLLVVPYALIGLPFGGFLIVAVATTMLASAKNLWRKSADE